MKIIPTILTDDPKDLELKIRQSESFIEIAQIDIMDGKFVPSRSITAQDLEEVKTSLYLEIHLMVEHPLKEILPFKKAGAKRIIFHIESKDNPEEVIENISRQGMELGIAVNPQTSIERVKKFLERIDLLLILSVNPGFYGSKFLPEVLDKVNLCRFPEKKFLIGLDGGIKMENILLIKDVGVDIAYVGSGIFGKGDPRENFFILLEKIKKKR